MQFIISTLLLASIALASAEAPPSNGNSQPASGNEGGPYAPSGWKPSGRLLLLPARQVAPATEYGAPTTEAEPTITEAPNSTSQEDESGSAFQQQQQPGVEHGVYHVLLPDGRLQRVEYSTAPLNAAQQSASASGQQAQDNFQQEQNSYQQQSQAQSGKFQQSQFEQQNFPQVTQLTFPSSFPQPVFQQQQSGQYQFVQSGQSASVQQPENNRYQFAQYSQNGNFQSTQYQPSSSTRQNQQTNAGSSFTSAQSGKITQNRNEAQSQYPQQPEYVTGASQNQFNRKQFNQQAPNQNAQPSQTNSFSSETNSRFTNANPQVQQAEVVEYRPIYYAQQNAQEAPAFNGFVANVQYKDVEPITSPIYSYNPAPLVRVLRRTE